MMALLEGASRFVCYEADIIIFFCYCIRGQGLCSHLLGKYVRLGRLWRLYLYVDNFYMGTTSDQLFS
jgi:hypothetical protein